MILTLAYILQMISIPLLFYRIRKGPTWVDRVISADLLIVYLVGGLLMLQTMRGWTWDRDVVWMALALGMASVLAVSLLLGDEKNV